MNKLMHLTYPELYRLFDIAVCAGDQLSLEALNKELLRRLDSKPAVFPAGSSYETMNLHPASTYKRELLVEFPFHNSK